MSNYVKNILIKTVLLTGFIYGTSISSSTLNVDQNTLIIQLTGEINTTSVLLGRLKFDDDNGGSKPDIVLEGGVVLNSDSLSSIVIISLLYGGSIDSRTETIYGNPKNLNFWGINSEQINSIESMDLENLALIVDSGAFIDATGSTLAADTVVSSISSTGSGNPEILKVIYDANSNTAKFVFDRSVQFDQLAEDRSVDNGPGNGSLDPEIPGNDPGEDRNGNGVLDKEPNIIPFKIGFRDVENRTIILEGLDHVVETTDNDTISIILTTNDAKRLETTLDLNNLSLNTLSGAFQDTLYNPNLLSNASVTVIADSLPFIPDSVYYDITQNDLKIFFRSTETQRRTVSVEPSPVWTKISFSNGTDKFSLSGIKGSPLIKDGYKLWVKELLLNDQRKIETMFNNLSETETITGSVDGYSVYDEYFNGNIGKENIPMIFFYGNPTNNYQPPKIIADGVSYDASSNTLSLEWNINVGYYNTVAIENKSNEIEYSTLSGFGFVNPGTGDSLSLNTGKIFYHPNKKKTNILLSEKDQILLENYEIKDSLIFYMNDFTFYSANPFNNGCNSLSVDSGYIVEYVTDTIAPSFSNVDFNLLDSTLSVSLNKPTRTTNISASSFSILNSDAIITGTVIIDSGATFVSAFNIRLSDDSFLALEALPDSIKLDFSMVVSSNTFINTDGISNQKDTINTNYGRPFWIKSFEAFAPPPENRFSTIRYIGSKCDIYVDGAVWEKNISTSDIEIFVNAFENRTPQDTMNGILDLVTNYVGDIQDSDGNNKIIFVFTDILDEYGQGRNDTKSSLFIHGYTNLADTSDVDPFSNSGDIIYLDVNPASLDSSENDTNVLLHAAVSELTKLSFASNLPEQEEWIVNGVGFMLQKLIIGDVKFFGEGTDPTITAGNQLTYIGSGIQRLKSREDQWNAYLFFSYLQEKFSADSSGWDIIRAIANSSSLGMNAVQTGLESLGFSSSVKDIFADYGMACYLDLEQINSEYSHAYSFTEFDLQTPPSGKPASVVTWEQAAGKGAPYSFKDISPWSYNYIIMRGYFINLENEVVELCPDLFSSDTLIFDGYDGISYKVKKLVLKNGFLTDISSDYEVVDFSLNDDSYGYLPVTTDSGFAFKDTLDNPENGAQIIMLMIAKTDKAQPPPTYDFVISNILEVPVINDLYGFQNPGIDNYLELFVTSDRKIFDSFGVEGPRVNGYSVDDTLSITMPILSSFNQDLEVYHSSILMDNDGEYEFHYVGRDQSGNMFDERTFSVSVGMFSPGSNLKINLDNSSFSIPANSFKSKQAIISSEQLTAKNSFNNMDGLTTIATTMFGPSDRMSNKIMEIAFDISKIDEKPNQLSIYQYFNGNWRHIGGKKIGNVIRAKTRATGQFAILKGNHGPIYKNLVLPTEFSISQNYPNPFNPNTQIEFNIPIESHITLSVYNILGRKIAELEDGYFNPGTYKTKWNGHNYDNIQVATGVYFYELKTSSFSLVKKMILVK